MKSSGRNVMLFCLAMLGLGTVISALKWPPKAAQFPVAAGSLLFLAAMAELSITLLSKEEPGKEEVMDFKPFKLSLDTDKLMEFRRTISIFLWIIGFTVLVFLLGLPIAILLFIFLYLKLDAQVGWKITIGLTVGVGACFYFLFIWFLKSEFTDGLVVTWLKELRF